MSEDNEALRPIYEMAQNAAFDDFCAILRATTVRAAIEQRTEGQTIGFRQCLNMLQTMLDKDPDLDIKQAIRACQIWFIGWKIRADTNLTAEEQTMLPPPMDTDWTSG